uniref:Costars family protein ABRACL n=1 Tax=Oncorhynchus tshawytscha TaxID=74940 RepID=A0A8C8GTG1_ONCTS
QHQSLGMLISPHSTLLCFTHSDGQTSVKFGVLFNAYKCTNIFEALVVILREKIIAFEGELLLQGVHDNVDNHQLHSYRKNG